MPKEILLSTRRISKTFGPTKAVQDVSVDINRGEIRTIIGENGSGKSTFVSMVAGYQAMDTGEMTFLGESYRPANPMEAGKRGIAMILQEMGTIEGLSVAENIFLGNESAFIRRGVRDCNAMNRLAGELLNRYNLGHLDPAADISRYKFEERKMVEIVKAMYLDPQLLIIDETTTALSQKGRDALTALVKGLRDEGRSIVFISHDFEEILGLSDTITIFRDGHHIGTVDRDEHITEQKLKLLMVGRELDGRYYREDYGGEISREVVLDVQKLRLGDAVKDVSFQLRRGEILGLGGLTESGMHEVGKILCGAYTADSGHVVVPGRKGEVKSIRQSIDAGIGYVSKNRDQEALILYASIKENICASSLDSLKRGVLITGAAEKEFAGRAAQTMQVKMTSVNQQMTALSGGNKQKVALAKWIARDSSILVLDCPTRGIDVMVKAAIYQLMGELRDQGKSIVLISEELLELIGMSDRILVMRDGAVTGELERAPELTEQDVIQYMI